MIPFPLVHLGDRPPLSSLNTVQVSSNSFEALFQGLGFHRGSFPPKATVRPGAKKRTTLSDFVLYCTEAGQESLQRQNVRRYNLEELSRKLFRL